MVYLSGRIIDRIGYQLTVVPMGLNMSSQEQDNNEPMEVPEVSSLRFLWLSARSV